MLDPTTAALIIVCDGCESSMPCSEKTLIPYITYPMNDGVPTVTTLQVDKMPHPS